MREQKAWRQGRVQSSPEASKVLRIQREKRETRSGSKLAEIASSEPQRGWRERKLRVPRDKNTGNPEP